MPRIYVAGEEESLSSITLLHCARETTKLLGFEVLCHKGAAKANITTFLAYLQGEFAQPLQKL